MYNFQQTTEAILKQMLREKTHYPLSSEQQRIETQRIGESLALLWPFVRGGAGTGIRYRFGYGLNSAYLAEGMSSKSCRHRATHTSLAAQSQVATEGYP